MRKITYICNRCNKTLGQRGITKINVTMQKDANPVEKKTLDFCSACFLRVSKAFTASMNMDSGETVDDVEKLSEKSAVVSVEKKPAAEEKSVVSQERVEAVSQIESADSDSKDLKMGPLKADEKKEILRLYVEENMLPEDIAAKMNRLPRGIRRTINSAERSGELEALRAAFQKQKEDDDKVVEEEEDISRDSGSGASNAGIVKDGYTAPPQTEVIDGKRYDVGGVLALAKAGWRSATIAEERHYDEDVVRVILDKYMR